MTQMILKLKEDKRVCAFFDIVEALVLMIMPIALPWMIMHLAYTY